MQKLGIFFLLAFITIFQIAPVYIPHNQLTVHRGSARLTKINMPANRYGFTLQFLDISKKKTDSTIPFLFVHGHKGNVKQAISMNQYFSNKGLPIDMYSVDFKEGVSALGHSLLWKEAYFVKDSIIEIASRYPDTKIGLITHSMGGIVASLALTLPDCPKEKVLVMIALSTPFEAHPLNTYLALPKAYEKIHSFWNSYHGTFVLSVTGGVRDQVVPSQLTNIEEIAENNNTLHVYSTQIEGLHLEMDHISNV